MKKIHPELINYFKSSIRKPNWFLIFGVRYLLIIYKGLISNIRYKGIFINDTEINTIIKNKIEFIKNYQPKFVNYSRVCNLTEKDFVEIKKVDLVLADGSLFDYKTEPIWNYQFKDAEMGYALNRWGWIWMPLYKNTKLYNPIIIDQLVINWFDKLKKTTESDIWEPYSCAERISNYLLYSVFINKTTIPLSITQGLKEMAIVLLQNLEYKRGNHFFNHLLNNARGLYIYARMFGDIELEKIAKRIIEKYYDKIFNSDGFSREGSSHYQFIFTRWFIDIYIVSSITNDDFGDFIKPRLKEMIKSCLFFAEFNKENRKIEIPFIGDISPDFAPDILYAYVFSPFAFELINNTNDLDLSNKRELSYFVNNDFAIGKIKKLKNKEQNNIRQSNDGTWTKIKKGNKSLFFHFIQTGLNTFPTHEHIDTGSFVYFVDGQVVFTDPGRLNYNKEGFEGISATSHNTIIIDEFEPFPYFWKNKFAKAYKKVTNNFEINSNNSDNNIGVILTLSGFKRLVGDEIIITRVFKLCENKLEIIDEIMGQKEHSICTIFNIGHEYSILKKDGSSFLLLNNIGKNNIMITVNGGNKIIIDDKFIHSNIICKQYGKSEKGKKLIINQSCSLPVKNQYIIT